MLLVFAVHQGVNERTLHVSRGSSRYSFRSNIPELTKHPISSVNGNQRKGTSLIVARNPSGAAKNRRTMNLG